MSRKNVLLLALLFLGFSFSSRAQFGPVCPDNIDFELGNYSYWTFWTGIFTGGTINCPNGTTPVTTWHDLMSGSGVDPYGGFPVVAPLGGAYSMRLNNGTIGARAAECRYNIHVPSTSANYSLLYKYAVVLEDPGHAASQQPRFVVRAIDSATGIDVPCTIFNYVSTSTLTGSGWISLGSGRYYKPWTTGSLNLSGLGGSTVTVKFSVADCSPTGHFGYAYIDMACGIFSITTLSCFATSATVSGPPGFYGYTWMDSISFSISYGTGQTITIGVPSVTTTFALILAPYPGYGCADTLYAKMIPSNLVTSRSHDTSICFSSSVTLSPHATDILPLSYLWAGPGYTGCTTCDPITVVPPVGIDVYTVTSYDPGGCLHTDSITVTTYPNPVTITAGGSGGAGGASVAAGLHVCLSSTATLSDAVVGARWSTSSTNISIGSATGIIVGLAVGTAPVTYAFPGGLCPAYGTVTVDPLPVPISGPTAVCAGLTITMSDGTPGGTWSSGSLPVATAGSATGVITGVAAGTSQITYRLTSTGCLTSRPVTVNPLPAPILTATAVCTGLTTTLSDYGGGTWSSSVSPLIGSLATAGSVAVLTGITPGSAVVTYTLPTTCITTATVAINISPTAITGTPAVCVGLTTSLSSTPGGGTWTSSVPAIASVGSSTGVVFGASTGSIIPTAIGTSTISYTINNCPALQTVTVNPLPGTVIGPTSVCSGFSISLICTPSGGTWSSSNTSIATINPTSGLLNGGSTLGPVTITYTLPTGCINTTTITVNAVPLPVAGVLGLCVSTTSTLSSATTGGFWTTSGAVASVGFSSGVVAGTSSGTQNVTYTMPSGCAAIANVTVNATPLILGTAGLCAGTTTTLSSNILGGTWTTTSGLFSVDPVTGVVSASAVSGTGTVTYTTPTGCFATQVINVFAVPTTILGNPLVCVGLTTTLSNPVPGGAWTSSNTTIATINSATRVVTGVAVGTATITYRLTTGGCFAFTTVTVSTPPSAIVAANTICSGSTMSLSNSVPGGSWISSNIVSAPIVAVSSSSAIITAGPAGTSAITYTLGGSCRVFSTLTVNVTPTVAGPGAVCAGNSATLTGSPVGGTWSNSNPAVVTMTTAGAVASITTVAGNTGTSNITYTMPATGCYAPVLFTVTNGAPPITGAFTICSGRAATLSDAGGTGGTWTSVPAGITTGPGGVGIVPSVTGPMTIMYSLAPLCFTTQTINATPLPSVHTVTGGGNYCFGGIGVNLGLLTSTTGASYTAWLAGVPIATVTGTGTGISFGRQTAAGTYTIIGSTVPVGPIPTCTISMTGSATVNIDTLPRISGGSSLCVASTMMLLGSPAGGTWLSMNPGIATVGLTTGQVTGIMSNSCTPVLYTHPATGCQNTTTVCVNLSPAAIVGAAGVCPGQSTTLTNLVPGGTWSSSTPAVGSIVPIPLSTTDAEFTGGTFGTTTITYTLSNGCQVTRVMTVSTPPSAIAGTTTACQGVTMTVSSASAGGVWFSSNPSILATPITPTTAVITGSAGTSTITYSLGCQVTTTVTINIAPTAITGPTSVCQGLTTSLSNSVSGGVWSTSSGIITLGSAGDITTSTTPGASGPATVVYAIGGCSQSTIVTVNPISPTVGSPVVCIGNTTLFTNATPGGTWSSSNPSIAAVIVPTSGSVLGGGLSGTGGGTATITYTTPAGCISTATIAVSSPPTPISGSTLLCKLTNTTLSSSPAGGTWTSSNVTIASFGSPTIGVVTGNNFGTSRITYSLGFGCDVFSTVTVNPLPAAITGSGNVCGGSIFTTTVTSTSAGGVWSINPLGTTATINPVTGVITGSSTTGTAIVTYTLLSTTGCSTTRTVNVVALPPAITGPGGKCVGNTFTLLNAGVGVGTWSTSNSTVATVASSGPGSGAVTGAAAGTARISYTLGGCPATTVVTISPNPAAITSPTMVCQGQNVTVSNVTPGGVWSTVNTTIATIVSGTSTASLTTGILTGRASGTVIMSYTVGGVNGCGVPKTIIVNPISPILGQNTVCPGDTVYMEDTTLGGLWSSSIPTRVAAATLSLSRGRLIGILPTSLTVPLPFVVTYTMPTGCLATKNMTLNPLIAPINATPNHVCVNGTITMGHTVAGGTWSSSIPSVATINSFTGDLTGNTAGITTVGYTLGGCYSYKNVTVNPLPANLIGSPDVCVGSTTAYTNASPGGAWLSTTPAVATIGGGSGVVNGIAPGTSTLVYTLPTGCSNTSVITVDPIPSVITGPSNVCIGFTITLSTLSTGVFWSSSNPTVATVDQFGTVSGLTPGTTTITVSYPGGCSTSFVVTVNGLPPNIAGLAFVCEGSTITLNNSVAGGTWSSSNPSVATIGAGTGVVTGIYGGTTFISYVVATGCTIQKMITVNPLPAVVTGLTDLCVGYTTTLYNASGTGSWSSITPAVATVNSSGIVSGLSAGTSTISYTLPTGCATTAIVNVMNTPTPIMGNPNICYGTTSSLSNGVSGGTWSSLNPSIAPVGPTTGVVSGFNLGNTDIIYSVSTGTGCTVTMPVHVLPLPTIYSVTGGGTFCAGAPGVHVNLNGSTIGTNYFLYNGSVIATGPLNGTASALDFGLQHVGGTYHVVAVNTGTGCMQTMAGTAVLNVTPSVTPIVDVNLSTGGPIVCTGTSVTYAPIPTYGGTAPTYKWYVNGTNVSNAGTYTFIPAPADVLSVSMTSNYNCAVPPVAGHSVTMEVLPYETPVADFTMNPGDTVCKGSAVTLTAAPTYGGTAPTYAWLVNNVISGLGTVFAYDPVDGDVVSVKMNSNYPCRLASSVVSRLVRMNVDSGVVPMVSIDAYPSSSIGKNQSATLTAKVTNVVNPTYQWLKNGVPIAGATNASYTGSGFNNTPRQDSLTCIVTNNGICKISTFAWIYINATGVAVNSTPAIGDDISILPNPNNGEFIIKGYLGSGTDDLVSYEVTNMIGQVVYRNTLTAQNGSINERVKLAKTVANGMYLLTLHLGTDSKVFHVAVEQ